MNQDDQGLRELLHRAAPDLGTLRPPTPLGRAGRCPPTRLVAIAAAVAVVVAVAITIAVTRPNGHNQHARPADTPTPVTIHGTAALRHLVRHTPCPAPKGTSSITRAQLAAFPAVAAVTCTEVERTIPHQGEWSVLIKKASSTGITALKHAFELPDSPRPTGQVACLDVLIIGAPVLFVDAQGHYVVPRYPIDHTCNRPLPATLHAVNRQPWHAISTKKLQQQQTPAELAAGCSDKIKNVVALDVHFGIDASPGGPVFTYHPHAQLRACIYRASPRDDQVGDFVRGIHFTPHQSAQLRAALTGPGTTNNSCPSQDTFAAIATRGGDSIYLELGGCWRLQRDEPHVTLGTANPNIIKQLLGI